MRGRFAALLLGAGLCAQLVGCGGSSTEKIESSASELAAGVCDLAFRCCDRGELDFFFGPFVDAVNCEERLLTAASIEQVGVLALAAFADQGVVLPNLAALDRAITDGRVAVDADVMGECLALLDGLACNAPEEDEEEDRCVLEQEEPPSPCDLERLFVGLLGEGESCTLPGLDVECSQGLACRTVVGAPLGGGACVRQGDPGDVCFADDECDDELYCSLLDGTCQPFAGVGETCLFADRDDPSPPAATALLRCDPRLTCDVVTDTCVAPCQRGASCGSDEDCAGGDEAGLVCALGRCDIPRPLGLPCGADDDCEAALRCEPDRFDPTATVCSERIATGQPCEAVVGHDDCETLYCDAATGVCAAQVAAGGLCPSGEDAQCDRGTCATDVVSCDADGQCAGSGVCNLGAGRCEFFCVGLLPDGAACAEGADCLSGECVATFCRTLPLDDGVACADDGECASGFCNLEDARVCDQLPLADGSRCVAAEQCGSQVCFGGQCVTGLGEGQRCDDAAQPPCAPDFFCDPEADPPVCAARHETGQPCEGTFQCRGECVVRAGRPACDDTPRQGELVCDGGDAPPVDSAALGGGL